MKIAVDHRDSLASLLGYANELLRLGEKPILDVRDGVLAYYEHELRGLEGVAIPNDSGDWLRLERLHPRPPPVPDSNYLDWVRDAGRDIFETPQLRDDRVITVPIEDASDLVEAGLIAHNDVMPSLGKDAQPGCVDVHLQLANMPEFAAAFAEWVAGPWTEWAATEKPRRQSIAAYTRLFEAQQRIVSMEDDTPLEAIIGIGLARWVHPEKKGKINIPLIEASVELVLDELDGSLVVRGREQPPQLMLGAFEQLEVDGVGKLARDAGDALSRIFNDPDLSFSPHRPETFDTVLRMCAARLTGTAIYVPSDPDDTAEKKLPVADGTLKITDTWVLYVRQRSANFLRDDIQRLSEKVRAARSIEDLPAAAVQMTSKPVDAREGEDWIDLGDTELKIPEAPAYTAASILSSLSTGDSNASDNKRPEKLYFFPLPYNDDQIEIIQKLDEKHTHGVVVQGPPGTGKTHT
ncbi:MAG: very short patch repair endonuclease, partial [Acetobacteraceae bacterium]|nr:very short patch repair endonuclease [Acetobacteraceae bacterium]